MCGTGEAAVERGIMTVSLALFMFMPMSSIDSFVFLVALPASMMIMQTITFYRVLCVAKSYLVDDDRGGSTYRL